VVEIGNSEVIITLQVVNLTSVNIRTDSPGIKFQILIVIGDRLIVIALQLVGSAAIEIGGGDLGIYLQGSIEIGDGLVIFSVDYIRSTDEPLTTVALLITAILTDLAKPTGAA
jgi:hypothetical protein